MWCPVPTRLSSVVEPRSRTLARATLDQRPPPWVSPSATGSRRRRHPTVVMVLQSDSAVGKESARQRRSTREAPPPSTRISPSRRCEAGVQQGLHDGAPRAMGGKWPWQWRQRSVACAAACTPGDVVEVEAAQASRGSCAGGLTVVVGQTREAAFVELCQKAAMRRRVPPRRHRAQLWGSRSPARKDFAPAVRVRRGGAGRRGWCATTSDTRGPRSWRTGMRLPASVLTCKPGWRGPALVLPATKREAEDMIRRPSSPPLVLPRAAVDMVRQAHRGRRRGGRVDLVHTRGGNRRWWVAHNVGEGWLMWWRGWVEALPTRTLVVTTLTTRRLHQDGAKSRLQLRCRQVVVRRSRRRGTWGGGALNISVVVAGRT
jgi:hypothetical protein